MERLPRFWKDPEVTPDLWWAVGLASASKACLILYFITGNPWVYFLPSLVGFGVVSWWTWGLYKQSHEGFIAGYHARGHERLELLHRRKFQYDRDVEVDVSYSSWGAAAWTTDLKSGGEVVDVTFLKEFTVPFKPNHDVAVTDVANLGYATMRLSGTPLCAIYPDDSSWEPTSASGSTLDITQCVRECRMSDWRPVLTADNGSKPTYATIVYTSRVKRD